MKTQWRPLCAHWSYNGTILIIIVCVPTFTGKMDGSMLVAFGKRCLLRGLRHHSVCEQADQALVKPWQRGQNCCFGASLPSAFEQLGKHLWCSPRRSQKLPAFDVHKTNSVTWQGYMFTCLLCFINGRLIRRHLDGISNIWKRHANSITTTEYPVLIMSVPSRDVWYDAADGIWR